MATTSKYLIDGRKGDASPQGTIQGEKGNRYTDTVNNKVYECLGGIDWRLVESNETPLVERFVDKYSDLTSLNDFRKGETIRVNDRGAPFKITRVEEPKYVNIKRLDSSNTYTRLTSDTGFANTATGNHVDVNDEIAIKIKFPKRTTPPLPDSAITKMAIWIDGALTRFGWRERTESQIYVGGFDAGALLKDVKDAHGNLVDSYKIFRDKWYIITFKINIAGALTSDTSDVLGYFSIGRGLIDDTNAIIEYVKFKEETFKFNDNTKNYVTGDLGDVLNFYNNSVQSNLITTDYYNDDEISLTSSNVDNKFYEYELLVPDNKLSPQMLGYNANLNRNVYDGNYASDYINKIELSEFALDIPPGYYCLDKPIEIYSPQSHFWSGGNLDYNAQYEWGDKSGRVIFFTHKNIDLFKIFSDGVTITGGTYDVTKVPYWETKKEYTDFSSFPADPVASGDEIISTDEAVIQKATYLALDTGYSYMWDYVNSQYLQLSETGIIKPLNKKAVFRICFKDQNQLQSKLIDIKAHGNRDALKQEGGGMDIVLIDYVTETNFKYTPLMEKIGEWHNSNYDVYGEHMDVCIRAASDLNINNGAIQPRNSHGIWRISGWKVKQTIYNTLSANTNVFCVNQTDYILTEKEVNDDTRNTFMYIETSGNVVAGTIVDMGDGVPDASGLYCPIYGLTNNGANNVLYDDEIPVQYINEVKPFKNTYAKLVNPRSLIISNSRDSEDYTLINKLDNELLLGGKKGMIKTVKGYGNIGGNFDFESNKEESSSYVGTSLTEETWFTPLLSDDMFSENESSSLVALDPYNGANNDFIEIVLSNLDVAIPDIAPVIYAMTITNTLTYAERIQIIFNNANKSSFIHTSDTVGVTSTFTNIIGIPSELDRLIDKIIIRFIGIKENSNVFRFGSFAVRSGNEDILKKPFISIDGGQKIYGNLEVDSIKHYTQVNDIYTGSNPIAAIDNLKSLTANIWQLLGKGIPTSERAVASPTSTYLDVPEIPYQWSPTNATLESLVGGNNSNNYLKVKSILGESFNKVMYRLTTTVGQKLRISYDLRVDTPANQRVLPVGTLSNSPSFYVTNTEWETVSYVAEVTDSLVYFAFYTRYADTPSTTEDVLYIDNFSIENIEEEVSIGTNIELNFIQGRGYNLDGVSIDATTYTTSEEIYGGNAKCLINTVTQPAITGGTLTHKGEPWTANTNMYMMVEYDGSVIYWFEMINEIPILLITAATTLTYEHNKVVATSGTFNVTLPTAVGATGKEYVIKNSGTGVITVVPDGTETIDGQTPVTLNQYDAITIVSDGVNWVII